MRLARMGDPLNKYQVIEGDPASLYHDVVVTLHEEREINNGQPSFWARVLDDSQLRPGERVLHLGCGTGYYTAILAEIVGPEGAVSAIEIVPELAHRAADSLASWPNATVSCGSGASIPHESWDLIVVSAGTTHPLESWLAALRPNGRLLFPLTTGSADPRVGAGAMLLITRSGDGDLGARFLTPTSFVHFEGGRDARIGALLQQAMRQRYNRTRDVRSLRRDRHEVGEACWLHADTFCLSYLAP
jgi:protein-L-isoaspartate(D-aspartate) O-methyltransferase